MEYGTWEWFIIKMKMPPHRKYSKPIKKWYAKCNRRHLTKIEKIMWEELRKKKLGYKFRRQTIMFGWIADFWCPSKMLIVEIDGEYHNKRKQKEADRRRDNILNERGFKTIRFTDSQIINNLPNVIQSIKKELLKSRSEKV